MVKKSAAAVCTAVLGISLFGFVGFAQDATPVASPVIDCPTTTSEENTQIVNDYIDAALAGDFEAADALLADDHTHDHEVEGVEVPQDFLTEENLAAAAESNHTVDAIIAQDDLVAVEFTFEVSGEDVEGADPAAVATVEGIAFVRIECGEIAESRIEFDSLGLLLQLGYEVTPPTAP